MSGKINTGMSIIYFIRLERKIMMKKRKQAKEIVQNVSFKTFIQIQFILYMVLLLKFVVFKPTISDSIMILNEWNIESFIYNLSKANFEPLYTINNYMNKYRSEGTMSIKIFLNLIGNIIAFIPWGFCWPILVKKCKSLLATFMGSLLLVISIEVAQLITTLGSFDIDDIILNTLGAIIGYSLYKIGVAMMKIAKLHLHPVSV